MTNVPNTNGVTAGNTPFVETPHIKLRDLSKIAIKALAVVFVATVILAALNAVPVAVPVITGLALAILMAPRSWMEQLPPGIRKAYDMVAGTAIDFIMAPICGSFMVSDTTVKNLDRNPKVKEGKIDKVLSISSPFHGTVLGPLFSFFPCVAQMRHKDSYNEGLRAWMKDDHGTEFHQYGSESDIVILPHHSVHTEGKFNHPLEQGWGHLSILFSDKLIDDMAQQLDRNKPILFVHGFLGHSSNFTYIRYRLKKMGFKQLYGINLGHPGHSIDKDFAPKVVKEVDAITAATGKAVQIIAHSMGGLVSAQAAKDLSQRG